MEERRRKCSYRDSIMAGNNAVCTQDNTYPRTGGDGGGGGGTGKRVDPMRIRDSRSSRDSCTTRSLLACLLFVSLLSNVVIGEIAHELRSGSGNSLATDRSEYLVRRLFGNASANSYDPSGGGGRDVVASGKKTASAGEGRMCWKERGKRETGRKRRQRSNERRRTSSEEETGGRNARCSTCMREEMRAYSLQIIKDKILSKLGMSQPPNLKGKPLPNIGDHRLAALFSRRYPHNGSNGMSWVLQEDEFDRMQGDDPYSGEPSDVLISRKSDFSNKNAHVRSHGSASDSRHGYSSHFDEGEMFAEEEDDYHVRTEKIVTFSQQHPRVRHSPHVHYFHFTDKIRTNRVKKAVLWVYIKGRDSAKVVGDKITISIYRILHTGEGGPNSSRESPVITSVLTDLSQSIPEGHGAWITLDYIQIKNLVTEWCKYPQHNLGIIITAEDANRTNLAFSSHGGNSTSYVPFLELYVADNKKHRAKRFLGLNCNDSSNETRCCRYPLTVNFDDFGWDWVIAPRTYEANYCSGECSSVFLPQHPHTHIVQLADVEGKEGKGLCCSPKKLSAISMLYFDQNSNIIMGTLPDMVVDRCGCA